MVVRILAARWRRAALVALVVAFACDAPMPAITSLTFNTITERTSQRLVLVTSQCAPPFDLDNGSVASDPTASVQLDPGLRVLTAERTGDEQFQTTIPDDLLPGAYEIQLRLADGRAARYDGQFTVTRTDPVVVSVQSSATTVTAGQADVPLSVVLANRSFCAIDGLSIAGIFVRGGVNVSGDFDVHGGAQVHLDAGAQVTVALTVDVAATAAPGTVSLDAQGTGGVRSGPSCSGTAMAASSGPTSTWQIVAP